MEAIEIQEVIEQLRNLTNEGLFSSLAVLASGYKADWINNIQCEVVPKIKASSPANPYLTEQSKQACRDMVDRVTSLDKSIRQKALEELKADFVTDYYTEAGKLFFEEFRKGFREIVWGKDSPCDRFKKGLLGQSELTPAIVDDILKSGLAKVYIPLLVCFALLVVKLSP